MKIHPTAVIDPKAQLASDVSVGPFAVIGPRVKIGPGTEILSHCVIGNDTTIGARNRIFSGVVIGSIPQDLKYAGEPTAVVIGDNNTIREFVTINLSTDVKHPTTIGSNNLIMAYSHVAHDCRVGDHCVIANCGTLAGHVELEDRVIVGGLVAIHQFVRVGTLSIIGGCSKVVTDIPPYATCDGHPARFFGLNLVGLKRAGLAGEPLRAIKAAYKIYFQSGLGKQKALDEIRASVPKTPQIQHILDFVAASTRGLCHGTPSKD